MLATRGVLAWRVHRVWFASQCATYLYFYLLVARSRILNSITRTYHSPIFQALIINFGNKSWCAKNIGSCGMVFCLVSKFYRRLPLWPRRNTINPERCTSEFSIQKPKDKNRMLGLGLRFTNLKIIRPSDSIFIINSYASLPASVNSKLLQKQVLLDQPCDAFERSLLAKS